MASYVATYKPTMGARTRDGHALTMSIPKEVMLDLNLIAKSLNRSVSATARLLLTRAINEAMPGIVKEVSSDQDHSA